MTSEQFKAARKKLNLTQKELAHITGVGVRTIQQYEAPVNLSSSRKPHPAIIKIMEGLLKPEFTVKLDYDEYEYLTNNPNNLIELAGVVAFPGCIIELHGLKIDKGN